MTGSAVEREPAQQDGFPGLSRREQPLGELVKELAGETGTLVRQEIALAKAELAQKGREAAFAGALAGGGAVIGLLALVALMLCAIAALATGVHAWLAALIVGVVFALAAGVLGLSARARARRAVPPVPQETLESVKEDVEWLKMRRRSARK